MDVRLRKITERDTANIVRWRNSDDVRHWLFSQEDLTPEKHLWWLKNVVGKGYCAQYIIIASEGDNDYDIGTTFIKRSTPNSIEGEFGIFIGEAIARGRHCAFSTTMKMLSIGFDEMNLDAIFLTVFSENTPAVKTYLKVGFQIKAEYNYEVDKKRKIYKMEITKDCWLKKHQS